MFHDARGLVIRNTLLAEPVFCPLAIALLKRPQYLLGSGVGLGCAAFMHKSPDFPTVGAEYRHGRDTIDGSKSRGNRFSPLDQGKAGTGAGDEAGHARRIFGPSPRFKQVDTDKRNRL